MRKQSRLTASRCITFKAGRSSPAQLRNSENVSVVNRAGRPEYIRGGPQIVVEGFTDNVPIGPELRKRFPSNWELSSGRADDVLRFLAANEISGPDLSVDTSIEPGGE
jgi:flagellar motor protein MotB